MELQHASTKLNGLIDEVMAQDGFKAGVGETRVSIPTVSLPRPRVLL
jgi:hypothetical protein